MRDQIAAIRKLQAHQYVRGRARRPGRARVRDARRAWPACCCWLSATARTSARARSFPKTNGVDNAAEVLSAFVSQYYAEQPAPRRNRARPRHRGSRAARRSLSDRGRQARRDEVQRARRTRAVTSNWRSAMRRLALATELAQPRRAAARAVEALRDLLELGGSAAAHRVLRHQPHDGRGDGRLVRRVRCRNGPVRGAVSPLQHRRHRAGRRLRRDAPGARAALPPRRSRKTACCPTCC